MAQKGRTPRLIGVLLASLLLVACVGMEAGPSPTASGPAPSQSPASAATAVLLAPAPTATADAATVPLLLPTATALARASPVRPLSRSPGAALMPCEAGACVLFLGNSLTQMNDLPQIFAELAASGGHDVETGMSARGGWTLADHASAPVSLDMLSGKAWDHVVLQEQSLIPAVADQRQERMLPAVRKLEAEIRQTGAQPLLFLTWARRDGLSSAGFGDYGQMQAALESGYLAVAKELRVPVAPVGMAWQQAASQEPPIELWQADRLHPTTAGSYLAACVLYAVLIGESPEGLLFTAGLPEETARILQSVAAATVNRDPDRWNLP